LAENQDPSLLKRRARRRLVGAVALVVFVVIVLPIVLDKEPGTIGQDIVIQIPSQDAGRFNSRVVPPPPAVPAAPQGAPAKAEPPAPQAKASSPPAEPRAEAPAAPKAPPEAAKGAGDGARAKALLEGKEAWVVPLGAFASTENVKQLQAKLAEAGMKSYTEGVKTSQGEQTRVRAGPFETKAAAEQAREKLGAMGLAPAAVTTR